MLMKKDFKVIAEIIADNTGELHNENCNHYMIVGRNWLVQELANYFTTQNPRFNRQKFLDACGL